MNIFEKQNEKYTIIDKKTVSSSVAVTCHKTFKTKPVSRNVIISIYENRSVRKQIDTHAEFRDTAIHIIARPIFRETRLISV